MKEVALDWSLVTMVNNDSVLRSTLLASPALTSRCQVVTKRNFECAGRAYNAGLQEADHEIVVLAHQDVYLPETWLPDLSRALALLAASDPQWGVLGVFGIASSPRRPSGYCYSTGLRTILGHPYSHPIETDSLDELVLIVRRSAGLRFDERLPGFHLYGTDICLQARSKGLKNYIIPAFCIHNSNGVKSFPVDSGELIRSSGANGGTIFPFEHAARQSRGDVFPRSKQLPTTYPTLCSEPARWVLAWMTLWTYIAVCLRILT